jgi:hypothetical protein
MVMREMLLDRGKEVFVGCSYESRPALAVGNPSLLLADHRHLA